MKRQNKCVVESGWQCSQAHEGAHFFPLDFPNSPFPELTPVQFLHPHMTRTLPETFTTSDWCCVSAFRATDAEERDKKPFRGRWETHLVQECVQGSLPDSTSHLFLLLSSSGRRNFKWCLYLCCSGSGEQRRVLMWVKNALRRKSFHIPKVELEMWCAVTLGIGVLLCYSCMKYTVWTFKTMHHFWSAFLSKAEIR